ncbi:MAG TPA: glycosyltransferase family 1 protein, partial [Anaerolineae bacterium]|nr:glycosyltransferase family 1 protein [Anaerolineae bacterium]
MHIGLNAQLLSLSENYRGAGLNAYTYRLLQQLPAVAPELEYTAFINDNRFVPPPGLRVWRTRWPAGNPWGRILWEQLAQPWILRRMSMALLHGLAYALPFVLPCPAVVTIHDLSFIRYP